MVWAHPARITPEALRVLLEEAGLTVRPLARRGAYRIEGTDFPGRLFAYRAGLCHTQEEVSLVPPELLDARSGERVLDACAAPGGKTARIALDMGGRGTVVANDRSAGRLRALTNVVERLGLVNVVATRANAAVLPRAFGAFDRVLCDVPCSGEGTSRKNPRVLTHPAPDRGGLVRAQEEILARAFRLLRPGGRIVYSTCTYAPEENEAVVDRVLARCAGELHVVPMSVPGLASTPGITAWNEREFDPSLAGALRFWPHHGDSGGFFAVVLEKSSTAPPPPELDPVAAGSETTPDAEAEELVRRFAERYDVAEDAFVGLRFHRPAKKRVVMESDDLRPPAIGGILHRGVPFCHPGTVDVLPSTSAARRFANHAGRNVVALTAAQVGDYIGRREVRLGDSPDPARTDAPRGFTLVVHDGLALGSGVVRHTPSGTMLESLFPKPPAEPPE